MEENQRGFLEASAVTKATRVLYKKEIEGFIQWCDARKGKPAGDGVVGDALVAFMNERYANGDQASRGEKLLAALCHMAPEWGRLGTRKIPRSWIALRGWRKRCPSRSRRPFPIGVWFALAWKMILDEEWLMAMYTVMMLCLYLRPGEALTVRRGDLVPPSFGSASCWSLLLFPEERKARSKTGAKDDSLLFDTVWCKWLNQVVSEFAKGPKEEHIFPFSYDEYLKVFKKARVELRIPALVPYQARHSGPSVDRMKGFRDLADIQRRGRWMSSASVQRYERHARLGQTSLGFDQKQLHTFAFAEQFLEGVVRGVVRPGALPQC